MTARVRALAPAPADLQRRQLLLGAGLLSGVAILGGLAAPAHAQSNLSAADREVVQRAQAYLQGLTSAQGTFVETGPNGQRRQGRFYLQRPGKMRFEYDPPSTTEIIADGTSVALKPAGDERSATRASAVARRQAMSPQASWSRARSAVRTVRRAAGRMGWFIEVKEAGLGSGHAVWGQMQVCLPKVERESAG